MEKEELLQEYEDCTSDIEDLQNAVIDLSSNKIATSNLLFSIETLLDDRARAQHLLEEYHGLKTAEDLTQALDEYRKRHNPPELPKTA